MSKPLTLQIRPRGKPIRKLPEDLSTSSTTTTATLYSQLSQATSYSVHQLRITKGSDGSVIPNSTSITLSSLGLRDQSQIMVKDLGPQIAWRTVFLIEYLGPILIHPLIYLARPYIYPHAAKDASVLQTYTMSLIVLHFLKREFETIFIHKFSAATMPLRNIFKNCAHYWLLAGANIAAWIYAPNSPTAARLANPLLLYTGLALYTIGELGNLSAHYTLANLRSPGGTERGIPRGFLFDLVTCPNYFTETLSWIGVYLVSGLSWSVLVFAIASVGQMALWAKKKEMRYRKEFPGKYQKKRFTCFLGFTRGWCRCGGRPREFIKVNSEHGIDGLQPQGKTDVDKYGVDMSKSGRYCEGQNIEANPAHTSAHPRSVKTNNWNRAISCSPKNNIAMYALGNQHMHKGDSESL